MISTGKFARYYFDNRRSLLQPSMKVLKLLLAIALSSLLTVTLGFGHPLEAIAAEKIVFSFPVLGQFQLAVADLEVFARSGKITRAFAYYARFVDRESLQKLRQVLQTSLIDDPVAVYRLTNTPLGEDVLRRLGEIVYTHPERNGIYAIRAALITATAEPEGLTPLSFLRHFPTERIQLNTSLIFSLVKEAESLFAYKETTISAIAEEARREIARSANTSDNNQNLEDLSQLGKHQVSSRKMSFATDNPRQTGDSSDKARLYTQIYSPTEIEQPAPLAIITHGFGAKAADYKSLAKHLASHGYIVALPEHAISNIEYESAIAEEAGVNMNPVEFSSRPQDITYLLDRLEKHPDWQGKIDWSQVGILGHSLGGTTALLVSGADLNLNKIQNSCQYDRFFLNVSLFLQCRAKNLPPGDYNFRDPRIKAVIALNSIGSLVLGAESMSKITIPTLIIGGTRDSIAPFIDEQVHPFLWLTTTHKYLATVVGGGHVASSIQDRSVEVSDLLTDSESSIDSDYFNVLSLAFFETYIRDRPKYQSYLTASYAKSISKPELPLHLIRSLNLQQLKTAYGKTPPIEPIPQSCEDC